MKQVFYFFSIFLFSCTQTVEKPGNLLTEDKMINILTDIYIHQQSSYMNEAEGKPLDYARVNAHLLEQHGVNVKDFEESYEYYVLNPDLYEPMLLKIRNKLESHLSEEDQLKRENLRKETEKSIKK